MIGFLVIDKPPGITSHDVVAAVRAVTGVKKVGHTGTLDPFATGVLPLALGPATRLIQFLDERIKVYDATIAFGEATDTGDPTGRVVARAEPPDADADEVATVLQGFLGERMQTPPAYSAVKVRGKPLYHYARRGEDVEAEARPITIHDLEVLSYDGDTLRLLITCSRGTYARVLANEIAEALDSCGHLSALSRTRSGPFYLDDAVSMGSLAEMVAAEPGHTWEATLMSRGRGTERVPWHRRDDVRASLAPRLLRPLDALSHLPLVDVGAPTAARIRQGGPPAPPPSGSAPGSRYLIVSGDDLVAIAESGARGPSVLRVLPGASERG